MSDEPLRHFQEQVAQIVGPIVASMRRKRQMREEMIAHLWQVYQEELTDSSNAHLAMVVVAQRFGDTEELRNQLQESIPWIERVLVTFFGRKENPMSRFWIAWIVLVLLAFGLVFPQFVGGVLAGLAGVGLARHVKIGGPSPRIMLPLLGLFGVLFGTALILPALARWKRNGYWEVQNGACMTAGTLIVIAGLMLLVRSVAGQRVRMA
jgi:uncharacterized membrane protein YidH (DUF202 family)